ncbi:hypothetical protein SAMN05444920_106289 [Nonomuraea solani]|uniref:Uncharacterized protein n=1 Tax=Nonomuraea solani TaxID=1144553 RepID=A0A1H6DVF1_9ACTN|nr:hypothetical protein [Nonomuraea solani]SEG88696.1 hypothetical protein SAMN05444920_106289 [Nonomuraea solani]
MRRHRFGRIAALLAAVYVTVVVGSGVLALTTGDPTLLREIVTRGWGADLLPFTWWIELLIVAGGILLGWGYWQMLRGRPAGPAAVNARPVRLLRAALYISVACSLLIRLPIPYQWWFGLPGDLVGFAIVWLFFVVLAGVLPRWLRVAGLVAGLANAAMQTASTLAWGAGSWPVAENLSPYWLGNTVLLLWVVPVLIGQARDPRWSRGTVRMGMAASVVWLLSPGGGSTFSFGGGDIDYRLLVVVGLGFVGVFGMVWMARSAHDLGGPVPVPAPARPVQVAAARPWPLAAVVVALPLIPAAVNLAGGMPVWIGPRGAVDEFFHGYVSHPAALLWFAVDLLVGVGAPAVLILVAVVRRTRRLLRATMAALTLAAVAGVVTALTSIPEPDWLLIPEMTEERLGLYPGGLFTPGKNGEILFGLSPLWYGAALAASALLLLLLYGARSGSPHPAAAADGVPGAGRQDRRAPLDQT